MKQAISGSVLYAMSKMVEKFCLYLDWKIADNQEFLNKRDQLLLEVKSESR